MDDHVSGRRDRALDVQAGLQIAMTRIWPRWSKIDDEGLTLGVRFTIDVVEFGTCMGLGMHSWDHPAGEGMGTTIERLRLQPVTCLASPAGTKKRELIRHDIVLVRDLLAQPQVLEEIQVPRRWARRTLDEADALLNAAPLP